MRLQTALATVLIACSAASVGTANPNEAPDITQEVADMYSLPVSTLGPVEVMDEDLNRDGLSATYYARFETETRAGINYYAEVDRGDGYIVLQKTMDADDPWWLSGNVLGAYENGEWQVQVNMLEMHEPGGSPLNTFNEEDTVLLFAGSQNLEEFLTARNDAMALRHTLEMEEMAREDERQRLARELEREREVLEAKVAAEAEEERRLFEQQRQAAMVAERAAADEIVMSLFEEDRTHTAEIMVHGQRLAGTLKVGQVSDKMVHMEARFDRDNEVSLEFPVVITLTPEPGNLHLRADSINSGWNAHRTCEITASPNAAGAFVLFEATSARDQCNYNILINDLADPAPEAE